MNTFVIDVKEILQNNYRSLHLIFAVPNVFRYGEISV